MWGKLAFSIGLVSMGIVIGSLTNLVNLNGSEESILAKQICSKIIGYKIQER